MFPGVDQDKASTFFHYCGHAARKINQRDFVRRDLEDQIVKMRKLANKDFKGHLEELERKIGQAIEIEQRVSKHQGEEDVFHRKLKDKMEVLEKRLGVFLENREARAERIRSLERKILERLSDKSQKIAIFKDDIKKLEAMHKELSKSKKYKSKLAIVDDKLKQLKARVKTIETTS